VDNRLYKNGFLSRDILFRIAMQQLNVRKENKYSTVATPISDIVMALEVKPLLIETSSNIIPAISIDNSELLKNGKKNNDEFSENEKKRVEIENIDILLDKCLFNSNELKQKLYWSGELESRKINYIKIKENKLHNEGNTIEKSDVIMNKTAQNNSIKNNSNYTNDVRNNVSIENKLIEKSRIFDSPILFYDVEKFMSLLLVMIHDKTERNIDTQERFT
jgi:hypothetical protein